ncbi:hsp70-Hsp90 organizing protein-like [Gigantopelta aegis]|uniref:hsp70-Hsp90 organizing protein-like n=1 Tax=Gigantopelta aegis TaxID=1735272 RepID=UPI001B88B9D7|nr:hsp70-Hsp90 organizing protein-like [Gigantopelta aegis]
MDPIGSMMLTLQGAKADGEKLLKQNRYEEALGCYNVALQIAMQLGIREDEVAKIFSNRSLVFAKLGSALNALSDAEQCIGLNPKWWKVGHFL